jgi:hypothetical protein
MAAFLSNHQRQVSATLDTIQKRLTLHEERWDSMHYERSQEASRKKETPGIPSVRPGAASAGGDTAATTTGRCHEPINGPITPRAVRFNVSYGGEVTPAKMSVSNPTSYSWAATGGGSTQTGVRLGLLVVFTYSGGGAQWTQYYLGAPWNNLSYGNKKTPALGQALMQILINYDGFSPDISAATALPQIVTDLIAQPLANEVDTVVRRAVQGNTLQFEPALPGQLVQVHHSVAERWPIEWSHSHPPDFYSIVRVHLGWDSELIRLMGIDAHTLTRHLHFTALGAEQFIATRKAISPLVNGQAVGTNMASARLVHASLDRNYRASDDELIAIDALVRLGAHSPTLWDGTVRPVRLPRADDEQRSVSDADTRLPRLRDGLYAQLCSVDNPALKEWRSGQTIQLAHLRIILEFMHGSLRHLIPTILKFGVHTALSTMRTLLVARITDRFNNFQSLYSQAHSLAMLDNAVETQTRALNSVIDDDASNTQAHADAFVEGLTQIALMVRAIPYTGDFDFMARQELRRCVTLKRIDGINDQQWWSEVVKRYKHWTDLLGKGVMQQAHQELRDFLVLVAHQLHDRHVRNQLVVEANNWLNTLAAHFQVSDVSTLIGRDIRVKARAPVFPSPPGTSLAYNAPMLGNAIDTIEDLRKIYDTGETLRGRGVHTHGGETTCQFLEYTHARVGDVGLGQALTGSSTGKGDMVLTVDSALTLYNDVLYCGVDFPDLTAGHTLDGNGDDILAVQPGRAITTESLHADMENLRDDMAAVGDLMRTQYNNLSSTEMRKATPARPDAARVNFAGTDDRQRKNLGVPRQSGPPPRRPRDKMRYEDKPPTEWADMDETGRTHLGNAYGIKNAQDWQHEGTKPCPMCDPRDHRFNRCLRIWSCTANGKKFLGAEKAAGKVRDMLKGISNIHELEALYNMVAEPGEYLSEGLYCLKELSPALCAMCNEDANPTDGLAAYTDAGDKLLSLMCLNVE